MKDRLLIGFYIVHASLSFGGFLLFASWVVGFQDGGGADPGLAPSAFGVLVHYVLLQPVAHWVLALAGFRWWTWAGLGAVLAVVLINSLIVAIAVGALRRAVSDRSAHRRLPPVRRD
jgi:hypothetical protein